MSITTRIILNDLRQHKARNATLLLLLFLAALLLSSGGVIVTRLADSMVRMSEQSLPPQVLQMHVGPVDPAAIAEFARTTEGVSDWQIQDMADVDSAAITYATATGERGSLSDSLLDNYFVAQNRDFDFLLDAHDNTPARLAPGELGLPMVYAERYGLGVGDTLTVTLPDATHDYRVAALVRDGQMGSSMASSIRLLLSDADFEALLGDALRRESIIGFRLSDPGAAAEVLRAYTAEDSGLPANGPAVTWQMIRLFNGLADGLVAAVITTVALALMLIALLAIRFSLTTTLSMRLRQIGVLRAIGLPNARVGKLYTVQYRVLALIAGLAALVLTPPLSGYFLVAVSRNYGLAPPGVWTLLLPLLAVALVWLTVDLGLRRMLRRAFRLPVVAALHGDTLTRPRRSTPRLVDARPLTLALGLQHLRLAPGRWLLYGAVFLVSTLIAAVPVHLLATMSSPSFITYLGAVPTDVLVTTADEGAAPELARHPEVEHAGVVSHYRVAASSPAVPERQQMQLQSADPEEFAIPTVTGVMPTRAGEIALSTLNAERFAVDLGGRLTVEGADFTLMGTYQDVTNGGLTAKVVQPLALEPVGYTIGLTLVDAADPATFAAAWTAAHPTAQALDMDAFIGQSFGAMTASLRGAVLLVGLVAVGLSVLISVLVLTLMTTTRQRQDATLSALGWRRRRIRAVYLVQAGLVGVLGALAGAFLSVGLGQPLVGAGLGLIGLAIVDFSFLLHPLWFALAVGLPLGLGLAATWLTTSRITTDLRSTT